MSFEDLSRFQVRIHDYLGVGRFGQQLKTSKVMTTETKLIIVQYVLVSEVTMKPSIH